jgi:hypothetical protein
MSALTPDSQPLQQRASEATLRVAALLDGPDLGAADLHELIVRLGDGWSSSASTPSWSASNCRLVTACTSDTRTGLRP